MPWCFIEGSAHLVYYHWLGGPQALHMEAAGRAAQGCWECASFQDASSGASQHMSSMLVETQDTCVAAEECA
jgi:predicted dithiol-disulfide oxidoreductase (DUF899 family)